MLKWVKWKAMVLRVEFRQKNETWFAGTPPLESLRVLCRFLADKRRTDAGPVVMAVVDVKRAHFHARASRRLFIELPKEDARHGEPDLCGELVMSLYGTRDAAFNWEEAYSTYLQDLGFERGKASPCHFFDARRQLRLLVHGDDFVAVGPEGEVDR